MTNVLDFELDKMASYQYQRRLYRITANEAINEFKISAGCTGGLVENPDNIIESWVEPNSIVLDNAVIRNCRVSGNAYVRDNVHIIGNGYYIGGNMGDVTLGGNIILELSKAINIGPINIIDDCAKLSDADILPICGVLPNKAYGGSITIYRKEGKLFCYNYQVYQLVDLPMLMVGVYGDEMPQVEKEKVMALGKHIIAMAKSYFKI